jgi:hypothetical protein
MPGSRQTSPAVQESLYPPDKIPAIGMRGRVCAGDPAGVPLPEPYPGMPYGLVVSNHGAAAAASQPPHNNAEGFAAFRREQQGAVSIGHGRDDERRGFSDLTLRPTKWQSSVQPVRLLPHTICTETAHDIAAPLTPRRAELPVRSLPMMLATSLDRRTLVRLGTAAIASWQASRASPTGVPDRRGRAAGRVCGHRAESRTPCHPAPWLAL